LPRTAPLPFFDIVTIPSRTCQPHDIRISEGQGWVKTIVAAAGFEPISLDTLCYNVVTVAAEATVEVIYRDQ